MQGIPEKKQPDRVAAIASAVRTVSTGQSGMAALAEALDNGLSEPFADAVALLSAIRGRVIATGVGKSHHIGSKLAARRCHPRERRPSSSIRRRPITAISA